MQMRAFLAGLLSHDAGSTQHFSSTRHTSKPPEDSKLVMPYILSVNRGSVK